MRANKCLCLALGITTVASLMGCSARIENNHNENASVSQKQVTASEVMQVMVSANCAQLTLPLDAKYSYARLVESASARTSQLSGLENSGGVKNLRMDPDTGLVSFQIGTRDLVAGAVEGLPDKSAAEGTARQHLARMGLLPENDAELVVVHVGGINSAVYTPDTGETAIYRNFVTVHYGRRIGSLRVEGNSRIVVRLGKDGELASVIRRWTNVASGQLIPTKDIMSVDEAVAGMKKLLGERYAKYMATIRRINVAKLEYVMYDDGNVIEPALCAVGTIESSGRPSPEKWIAPVLRNARAHYKITETIADVAGPQDPNGLEP